MISTLLNAALHVLIKYSTAIKIKFLYSLEQVIFFLILYLLIIKKITNRTTIILQKKKKIIIDFVISDNIVRCVVNR